MTLNGLSRTLGALLVTERCCCDVSVGREKRPRSGGSVPTSRVGRSAVALITEDDLSDHIRDHLSGWLDVRCRAHCTVAEGTRHLRDLLRLERPDRDAAGRLGSSHSSDPHPNICGSVVASPRGRRDRDAPSLFRVEVGGIRGERVRPRGDVGVWEAASFVAEGIPARSFTFGTSPRGRFGLAPMPLAGRPSRVKDGVRDWPADAEIPMLLSRAWISQTRGPGMCHLLLPKPSGCVHED